MSVHRIALVARQTFAELLSERLALIVLAFAAALFAVSRLVGPLSAGEELKIVKDFGLAAIELAGAMLAVLFGVAIVSRGAERGTLLVLLAKPLRRSELVVGQFTGIAGAVVVCTAAMGSALFGVLASMGGASVGPEGPVPAIDPRLGVALLLVTAELVLVAAVAIFFATFTSSAAVAAVLCAGVFVAGQLSADLRGFAGAVDAAPWIEAVVSTTGWLLPAFSSFDVKAEVVHGLSPASSFVAAACAYAVFYGTALVAAAAALFSRREFP